MMLLRALTLTTLLCAGCGEGDEGPMGPEGPPGREGPPGAAGEPGPTSATFTRDGFTLPGLDYFPEGIAVDDAGRFYVGSVAHGGITRASLADGTLTMPFDTGDMTSAVGMIVHDGSLWVCNSSSATGDVAEVVAFDLESGEELVRHPFPSEAGNERGSGFCNDITFDADGNLYATDSFGDAATNPEDARRSRILRVSAADLTSPGAAELWLEHDDFEVPADAFGLNGIDADGAERIFVVRGDGGRIFEIPIESDGGAGEPAAVDTSETLESGDGLKLFGDSLLLVQSSTLTQVSLSDGEVTLLTDPDLSGEFLTTFALFGTAAWVVEGQLDHLLGLDPTPPELPFRVLRVPLP
jgi:sugar lactone lactonase YvrE